MNCTDFSWNSPQFLTSHPALSLILHFFVRRLEKRKFSRIVLQENMQTFDFLDVLYPPPQNPGRKENIHIHPVKSSWTLYLRKKSSLFFKTSNIRVGVISKWYISVVNIKWYDNKDVSFRFHCHVINFTITLLTSAQSSLPSPPPRVTGDHTPSRSLRWHSRDQQDRFLMKNTSDVKEFHQ